MRRLVKTKSVDEQREAANKFSLLNFIRKPSTNDLPTPTSPTSPTPSAAAPTSQNPKKLLKKSSNSNNSSSTTSDSDSDGAVDETEKIMNELSKTESNDLKELDDIETNMFKVVKTPINRFYVDLDSNDYKIWTLTANTTSKNTPIVIVHGFCGGIGFWIHNIDTFAEHHPFYAFDLLGFSRSTRPTFSTDPAESEKQFLDSIEEWRIKMNIDHMILFGHSFGGFLATVYSLKYPERVKALILIDPWGFNDHPKINKPDSNKAMWVKAVNMIQSRLGPLDLVRVSGPVGLTMFRFVRPNYRRYFDTILDDPNLVYRYIYYANLPNPTGEVAFKNMSEMLFYAKNPVIRRIDALDPRIPIWFVYGKKSFIDSTPSFDVEQKRRSMAPVSIKIIEGADHHVYALKAKQFNDHIRDVLQSIRDQEQQQKQKTNGSQLKNT